MDDILLEYLFASCRSRYSTPLAAFAVCPAGFLISLDKSHPSHDDWAPVADGLGTRPTMIGHPSDWATQARAQRRLVPNAGSCPTQARTQSGTRPIRDGS